MKVQLSLDDELVRRVDTMADAMYMSRSGYVTAALMQYVQAQEVSHALGQLSVMLAKVADTGRIDADTQQQLEDFQRLVALMRGEGK